MVGALLIVGVLLLAPAASAASPPILNIPYGASEKQVMDVYPAANPGAPLVVMAHSGGWKDGDKQLIRTRAAALQKAGFAAFNADYRLDSSTVGAFPMEVEDIEAATRYAIAHAGEYNADPLNVVLLGGSAAGQLVASASERMNQLSAGTIRGVITLSGPFDLLRMMQDSREGKLAGTLLKDVTQALNCSNLSSCETTEKQALAVQWSPALQPATPCAPWLIFNSESEVMPLDQPQVMTETLEKEACPVTERLIPGKLHAFAYWKIVQEQIFAFIRTN